MCTERKQHILVGIDGSTGSEAALRWAYTTAQLEHQPVTALLGWTADGLPRPVYQAAVNADHLGLTKAAEQTLHGTIARVPVPDPPVELHQVVVERDPVEALIHEARNATMTVIGTSGSGFAHRVLAGSVAQQLLHQHTGPVVVVRGDDEPVNPDQRPIVVGVDGSDPSCAAVRWAADQAAARDVPLYLINAYRVHIAPFAPPMEYFASLHQGAEQLLTDTVTANIDDDSDLEIHRIAADDSPSRALLHAAQDAQLLVVGTRGRGGFAELVLGSTAHQCVLHAPCPVAVVHA
ncbi:Universal stress protein UspA-like protein [Frankia sp. AiPs1]|uniref:universal stress protein n=1 Tax=Frankia sp. AiPa1 TaxID=573492 RepID=UPI00202B37AB|nr:universal stress protein [Frankia sp. AiPa1]MCL9761658.1 universal stress protein [Frankia sp. AiPa1]